MFAFVERKRKKSAVKKSFKVFWKSVLYGQVRADIHEDDQRRKVDDGGGGGPPLEWGAVEFAVDWWKT